MRLIILGPPGAGKGTQATLVAERHRIPAISTGDIFRAHISGGTDLGRQVKDILASGGYVTDDITNAIVRARLAEPDAAEGFLLDGYPRTLGQVEALDEMLTDLGTALDGVLELTVEVDEVVARIHARALEQDRADDDEQVVRTRMRVYAEETAPLADHYAGRGLLRRVDGMGTVEEVAARLDAAIAGARAERPDESSAS